MTPRFPCGLLKTFAITSIGTLSLYAGHSDAASASCFLSNLAGCNVTVANVQYSNFLFTGFMANTNDAFNLDGFSSGSGGAALSFSPNRNNASVSGSFSYTATLLGGKTFTSAQANITGAVLGGGNFTTTLSSSGLPTSPMSNNGAGASQNFNTGLTSQTFSQSFAFNYVGDGDNLTNVGGVWVATSPSTTAVPGPLPLLGTGAAFAFSRKLRQRIKASA